MNCILRLFMVLGLIASTAFAQTTPPPPTKVVQPDGTIQLVPVPPAFVYTPYYIDPTMKFEVLLSSNWSNKDWNGASMGGRVARKGDVVTASIFIAPIPKTKTVNGKIYNTYSVFRSGDFVITWDPTIFEQLPPQLSDPAGIFDPTKSGIVAPALSNELNESALPQDGNMLLHTQVYPAPEKRTPALKPLYYQWNWDGFLWQAAYRVPVTLQFKVKEDFYYPTSKVTSIKVVPALTVNGVETKTRVDGGVLVGDNTQLGVLKSSANDIKFGAPSEYKVSHRLAAPSTPYKVGDTVPVKILIKNETSPQSISSVSSIFSWDNTKLEFMGLDKTGAKPSMENAIYWPLAGRINESSIPKDGNAHHNWLNMLGDKTFIDKEILIVTLNFKVVAPFDTTTVSLLKKSDPSLVGLIILDECGILGSSIPGSFVTGTQTNATITGTGQ